MVPAADRSLHFAPDLGLIPWGRSSLTGRVSPRRSGGVRCALGSRAARSQTVDRGNTRAKSGWLAAITRRPLACPRPRVELARPAPTLEDGAAKLAGEDGVGRADILGVELEAGALEVLGDVGLAILK